MLLKRSSFREVRNWPHEAANVSWSRSGSKKLFVFMMAAVDGRMVVSVLDALVVSVDGD